MKQILRKALAHAIARMPKGVLIDREHFEIFQSAGVHVTPVHFYEPVPDTSQIDPALWNEPSKLVGIDKNMDGQSELLQELCSAGFIDEYHRLPANSNNPNEYSRGGSFGGADGAILYSMIRKFRPAQIIEIGGGHSSLLSLVAMNANGTSGRITSIDPFPQPYLKRRHDTNCELIESRVEQVPLRTFERLEANDILFIDSSHVIRIGGDVLYEYLEILPQLNAGVIIHIHDIFMPHHYFKHWVLEEHRFWTEQYLVQAFLSFNKTFKILWAFGLMDAERPQELLRHFPDSHTGHGSSLWIIKTQ